MHASGTAATSPSSGGGAKGAVTLCCTAQEFSLLSVGLSVLTDGEHGDARSNMTRTVGSHNYLLSPRHDLEWHAAPWLNCGSPGVCFARVAGVGPPASS
eukprot:COSAG02_NODE_7_length_64539_cov_120.393482_39_plen_99_part_00